MMGQFGNGSSLSRFVINDLAGTDGVGDLGEVANVGDRVAIKNHEIGVKSLFDLALLRGLEIQSGVRREGSEHLAFRKRPVHEFVFERCVVDRGKSDVGPEENGATMFRKSLELVDTGLDQPGAQGRTADTGRKKR